ncbi:hypothetical protein BU14_0084s0033 [Porphyra umbilicalis]|uniref:Uncharacterized protein n=1 Tax=Porphyra umbilicalis TaxID=2786 RepID=A0A1X6PEC2_PORUM|nr:hypothetical protein BU14_0084s0033 [Porphyra umbilicalis]|eukprot:OSX79219.1 hypothetical protein BU14_0084s0033 [Porphyra umbilicalis]
MRPLAGPAGGASANPLPLPLVAVAVARPPTEGGASPVAALGLAPIARVLRSLLSPAPPHSAAPAVLHDGDARSVVASAAVAMAEPLRRRRRRPTQCSSASDSPATAAAAAAVDASPPSSASVSGGR